MKIEDFFKTLIELTDDLYLVGGSVRDYLLKKDCYDYDFAIQDRTIEIGKLLANKTKGSFFILDYERETIRVVWNIEGKLFNFDIAKIIGETIENDLILRDLTFNSIGLKVTEENYKNIVNLQSIDQKDMIDPTAGIKDLQAGLIKTYKKQNLLDDPLRMVRVFRFYTKLDFEIESNVLIFISEIADQIKIIAKERILKELYDLLAFNHSYKSFEKMFESKLLENIFSDIAFDKNKFIEAIESIKEIEKQIDLINSNQKIEDNSLKIFSEELNKYLANLLILNKTINEAIKLAILFYHIKSENLSNSEYLKKLENYLKSFTFSVNEQKFILRTVRYSLDFEKFEQLTFDRKSLYLFFKERKDELISNLLVTYINGDKIIQNKVIELLEIYFEDKILSIQPEIINGDQIMKHFNLKPGRIIGELLEKVRQWQAEKIIIDYDQAINFISLELNSKA